MNNAYGQDDSLINSIVGEGTHFRGNVELDGLMRIDGDFTGSIRSNGKIIVGKNGRADCTIHAGTVVVGGVFRGALYASEKVIILASALVIGIIHSPRLIAEEGVLIDGEFRIYGAPVQPSVPRQAAAESSGGGWFGLRLRNRRPEKEEAGDLRDGEGARGRPSDREPGNGSRTAVTHAAEREAADTRRSW